MSMEQAQGAGPWTGAVEYLAAEIHRLRCDDTVACGYRDNPQSRHRRYYLDRARAIIRRLEPEIGIANVPLAVHVVLEELS